MKREDHPESKPPATPESVSKPPSAAGNATLTDGIEGVGRPRMLRNRTWLLGLLLIVVTLLAYQPAWHAGFLWEDDIYVTNNSLLTASDGLKRIWFSLDSPSQYFPLTYTTFRLERPLWGLNPAGYHWVNLLLHTASALLVWRLLKQLGVPGAWLAASIFALHPVQVESVAWIAERKNVLSLFFFLLSLLAWVEFIEDRAEPRRRFYLLSLLFFALSLFSKTTTCMLPVAALLILWLKGKPINRLRLAQMIPFGAMALGMGLITVWWERYHQGTHGALFSYGPVERVLIASHALWFYLGKLVWPSNLTFSYPRWTLHQADPFAYGWLAAGIAAGLAIYLVRRLTGRGLGAAALFYAAMLSPMLGFIMLYTFRYSFVADHYQYAASIGPFALAAAGLTAAQGSFGGRRRFLEPAIGGVVLLTLAILTWRQCGMYSDLETLWRTTIARNPEAWMAHDNLSSVLFRQGRTDEALAEVRKALAIEPDDVFAHDDLGTVLFQEGQMREAAVEFEKVLKREPRDPIAHYHLGTLLLSDGRVDEAIVHFQQALAVQPAMGLALDNLGIALLQKSQEREALAQFEKALICDPDDAIAHYNIGEALFQHGRVDEAIGHFQKAQETRPGFAEAHNNLGVALLQKGRMDDAIAQFQRALEIRPGFIDAGGNLANAAWLLATAPEASVRNGAKAMALARQLDRLTGGNNPIILDTLAAACAETGQFPEAMAAEQRAIEAARAQNNAATEEILRQHLKLFQSGSPVRSAAQTQSDRPPDQP